MMMMMMKVFAVVADAIVFLAIGIGTFELSLAMLRAVTAASYARRGIKDAAAEDAVMVAIHIAAVIGSCAVVYIIVAIA